MNLESLESKLSQRPQSPLFARLASEHLAVGRTSDAKLLLIAGIERYPAYATAHLVLAQCFQAEGHYSEALDSLDHAFALVPNSIRLKELRAEWNRLSRGETETLTEAPPVVEEAAEAIVPEEPTTAVVEELPPVEPSPEIQWEEPPLEIADQVQKTLQEVEALEPPTDIIIEEETTTEAPVLEEPAPPVAEEQEVAIQEIPVEAEAPPTIGEPTTAIVEEPQVSEPPTSPPIVEQQTETSASAEMLPTEPPVAIPPREIPVDTGVIEFQQVPPTSTPPTEPPATSDTDWRIITKTLAEIYASQGAYEEAIITYQLLKEQRPDLHEEIEQRMGELALLLREKIVQQKQK